MTNPVSSKIFVQAGAFSDHSNAKALEEKLKGLSETRIQEAVVGGKQFFRVQVGPVKDVLKADALLASVVAKGLDHAKIIVSKG